MWDGGICGTIRCSQLKEILLIRVISTGIIISTNIILEVMIIDKPTTRIVGISGKWDMMQWPKNVWEIVSI